jgi:hypothetical protein
MIDLNITHMKRLHKELLFFIHFKPNNKTNSLAGFAKELLFDIQVYASPDNLDFHRHKPKLIELTHRRHRPRRRILSCQQNMHRCNPIVLFNEPFVKYKSYIINVRFLKHEAQNLKNMFDPTVEFNITYVNPHYAWFELVCRYILLIFSFIFGIIFYNYVKNRQQFKYWHVEQKWIAAELFMLILFNNPLYILRFFLVKNSLLLVNIFFRDSFICFMLLSLLIFTHSMYTKYERDSFGQFYIPKLVIIVPIWIISCVANMISENRKIRDATYSLKTELPNYYFLMLSLFIFILFYLILLSYYVIRTISILLDAPRKYTIKFRIVWGMTLAILLLTIMTFFVLNTFEKLNTAIFLTTFQVLFNVYPMLLAILFLPSRHRETFAENSIFLKQVVSDFV